MLSGFLGTSGGLLYIPLFTYVLKVATPVAVGTSLLTILISGVPEDINSCIAWKY
ncbi:MAG: hypothetical protein DRO39_08100 [Thermoprotei archaeon]|nr:MAG: hypothetical protein DRO39_08100 [Thermoprotei archaeon]